MTGGRLARGHDLFGIFVAQLVELEHAALGDRQAFPQQRGRDTAPRGAAAAASDARRSDGVSCPPRSSGTLRRIAVSTSCSARRPRRCMCTSPAATRGRPSALPSASRSSRRRASKPPVKSSTAYPQTPGKPLAQPAAVAFVARQSNPSGRRQPENQASVESVLEILTLEPVAALGARAPRPADQTAERAVGRPIGGERHELEVAGAAVSRYRRRDSPNRHRGPNRRRNEIPRRR